MGLLARTVLAEVPNLFHMCGKQSGSYGQLMFWFLPQTNDQTEQLKGLEASSQLLVTLPLGVPKCPGMSTLTGLLFFNASLGYQPPLLEEGLGD